MLAQTFSDALVRTAVHLGWRFASLYRMNEGRMRRRVDRRCVTGYDDLIAGFVGGELEPLTERNYEKALRLMWKAELHAPYLGIHDASEVEKWAHAAGHSQETRELVELATSDTVRAEFHEHLSAGQREAVTWIMSLIVHGEAYALYTSATLLPRLAGTGSKLGMSMQVMEEAKHYLVLRAMVRKLADGVKPLHPSARALLEMVARAKTYLRLFGMNVLIEGFATQVFGAFADYPGFRHILKQFHLDESRHCAFPQNYARLGLVPPRVKTSIRHRLGRTVMLLCSTPLVFDYRPYFETLGIDALEFFGKFNAKTLRLAEASDLPLFLPRNDCLAVINLIFNAYVKTVEPEKYRGFRDYCLVSKDDIGGQFRGVEEEVFGRDLYESGSAVTSRFYGHLVNSIDRLSPYVGVRGNC